MKYEWVAHFHVVKNGGDVIAWSETYEGAEIFLRALPADEDALLEIRKLWTRQLVKPDEVVQDFERQ